MIDMVTYEEVTLPHTLVFDWLTDEWRSDMIRPTPPGCHGGLWLMGGEVSLSRIAVGAECREDRQNTLSQHGIKLTSHPSNINTHIYVFLYLCLFTFPSLPFLILLFSHFGNSSEAETQLFSTSISCKDCKTWKMQGGNYTYYICSYLALINT